MSGVGKFPGEFCLAQAKKKDSSFTLYFMCIIHFYLYSGYQEIRFESTILCSHMCGLTLPEAAFMRKKSPAVSLSFSPHKCGLVIRRV